MDTLIPGSQETAMACDLPVGMWFERVADTHPSAVAVEAGEASLTYAALDAAANQIAHGLRAAGVGPEVPVGICLERSLHWVVIALGILKAGGVYVPLEPSYPSSRVAWLAKDAKVLAIVSTREHAAVLSAVSAPILWTDAPVWAAAPSTRIASGVGPEHLAYIMYTSGSTGQPKGVGVTHRGVARLVIDVAYVELGPRHVLLQCAPTSFDAATFEIWGALLTGGRLVMPPVGPLGLRELGQTVCDRGVTTLFLTTALFTQMVEHELAAFGGVRQLLVGGEVVPVAAARRVLAAHPEMHLIHAYGPTENTTFSSCGRVGPEDLLRPRLPLGPPISASTEYVVTPAGELAQVGVSGELYLGGAGLARGYVGHGGLTASRFVPDMFSGAAGARLYRTGDQVKRLPNGALEFAGRLDTQVKVRGFRVEPGEVEVALLKRPGVGTAAVVARRQTAGGHDLVAFLVPTTRPFDIGELRAALHTTLPAYMIPAQFALLDQLPLTPNGKIDRKALRVLAETEAVADDTRSFQALTPTEEVLGAIWATALRLKTIARDDNFFQLGGNSLAAMTIVAHASRSMGVDVQLGSLFEHPTIATLARALDSHKEARREADAPILAIKRRGALPLTSSQERAWLMHRLDPTGLAYTYHATLSFTGELQPIALERSLRAIVQRHEAFRTTFHSQGSELFATAHEQLEPFPFDVVDIEGLAPLERQQAVEALTMAQITKPFAPEDLPLVRWTLLRLNAREHLLLHSEHHLVHDGWSFSVFLNELVESYRAFRRGEPARLEPIEVQCADFAAWEREQRSTPERAAHLDFWRHQLATATSELCLPYDRDRPAVFTFKGDALRLSIPEELYAGVSQFAARHAVTEFTVFFAAFVALLRLYGNRDISIGVGVANRRLCEFERVVGMLVNTVVFRVDAAPDRNFADLVQECWRVALDAYVRQSVPLQEVVRAVQPARDAGQNPLFRVMFNVHDTPVRNVAVEDQRVEVTEGLNNGSAKFDLNLVVIPPLKSSGSLARTSAGAAVVHCEYNTDVFDGPTIQRLTGQYRAVLERLIVAPDVRVSQLAPMVAEEIATPAETSLRSSPGLPVSTWFERMADTYPDAVAVEAMESRLTYAALDAAANQVAHALRSLGVGPEVPVGICLERSSDWVVVALGILKAGGVYVPLEPSYPSSRVAWLVADAKIRIVVSAREWAAVLSGVSAPILWRNAPSWVDAPSGRIACGVGPDHLAYVMYTSGSTGQPKGVGVPHRGITRLVIDADYVEFGPAEVLLQFAPTSFDLTTLEIWGALLTGGRVVIPPAGPVGLRELSQVVRGRGVTTLWLTSGLFAQVVEHQLDLLGGVRQLLVGGDVVPVEGVRRVMAAYPSVRVFNGYGPTENTTFSTCHRIEPNDLARPRLPIGRSIAGSTTYVVTAEGELAPVGVPGELYVGGAGLARGYVGHGGLTAARFVPDAFSGTPGARLYRTGDQVRRLPDGSLDFLGRLDAQVKVRGFRVEPGEIEAVLQQQHDVRAAVVVARPRSGGGHDLVAGVVPLMPGALSATDVRAALRGTLPDYMMPSHIVLLDELPLTANGKVDRAAVLKLVPASAPRQTSVPRRGAAVPVILTQTFEELLQVDGLSVSDNLFDLGCDSLILLRAHSLLSDAYPALALLDLFRYPTIASLTEHLMRTAAPADKPKGFEARVARHRATTPRPSRSAARRRPN